MSKSLAAEIARLRPVTVGARRRDRIEAVIEHLVEALNRLPDFDQQEAEGKAA